MQIANGPWILIAIYCTWWLEIVSIKLHWSHDVEEVLLVAPRWLFEGSVVRFPMFALGHFIPRFCSCFEQLGLRISFRVSSICVTRLVSCDVGSEKEGVCSHRRSCSQRRSGNRRCEELDIETWGARDSASRAATPNGGGGPSGCGAHVKELRV